MNARYAKELRRLFWAQGEVQGARELCEHMITSALDLEDRWIWRAMESGIVISYARPFGENTGLGTLPNRFREFEDPNLRHVHERLLAARDVAVAHNNLSERGSILAAHVSQEEATKIPIEVTAEGESWWTVPVPHLEVASIERIAALCRFQEARISRESQSILKNLTKDHFYSAGMYELGVDFP